MSDFVVHFTKDYGGQDAYANMLSILGNRVISARNPFGTYPNGSYFFEWEREWRKVGDFNFTTDDVAFLIIPEHLIRWHRL